MAGAAIGISLASFLRFWAVLFGRLMSAAFPRLPEVNDLDAVEAQARLDSGDMNFLLDADGNFVSDHAAKSRLTISEED